MLFKIKKPRVVTGLASVALGVWGLSGCGTPTDKPSFTVVREDPTDIPLRASTAELKALFLEGDAVFDAVYREPDGLGPNYIRTSCASCHQAAARGPGNVEKMAIVEADKFTPSADQSGLEWGHTVRPYYAGGATTALVAPSLPDLLMSRRGGPSVFGRGYMEAVDDREIERVEAEQARRTDGISGRINRVTYASQPNTDPRYHQHKPGDTNLIGRFGLKARIPTLDDFAADAAQGDMSMTSPMRPTELPNPGNLTDDFKPGIDLEVETINLLAEYMRLLEIPRRETQSADGPRLFESTLCSACHVPSLKTRSDYPIALLANIDAPVFTDFLLHDMGADLADGLTDGSATSREWRTTPLIGLRTSRAYLHDGRAATIEQAIKLHGGAGSEAAASAERFNALSDGDRAALIDYVHSL